MTRREKAKVLYRPLSLILRAEENIRSFKQLRKLTLLFINIELECTKNEGLFL